MAVNIDSDAEITSIRLDEQVSAPAPDAGYSHIFAKADGLYIVDDDDVVTGPFTSGSVMSNSNISPTSGDQTAVVNTRYFADLSGLDAERNFILPAATVGDKIVLNITVGDDAFEYVIKGDTGITINHGAAATEWSREFITGESVTLVADTTSNWQVIEDGRIPVQCVMNCSTGTGTWNDGVNTTPDFDVSITDIGGCVDLTNDRFTVRRAGLYTSSIHQLSDSISIDTHYCTCLLNNSSAAILAATRNAYYEARAFASSTSVIDVALADVYIIPLLGQNSENTTFLGSAFNFFSVIEIL